MTYTPWTWRDGNREPVMSGLHTPGEWRPPCFRYQGFVASGAVIGFHIPHPQYGSERPIARCDEKGFSPLELRANAHLIFAAPALLAALEEAADTIKSYDAGDQSSETGWANDELLQVWLRATEAIAKATGGKS